MLGILLYAIVPLCADEPGLSCSPDTPTAQMGDTITVRAFSTAADPHFTWSATGGTIAKSGAVVHWSLTDVPAGIYRATVQMENRANGCSIKLLVIEKVRSSESPAAIESGSASLLPGQVEESGYGLYSYLLLGAPPADSTRERYLQVINAYLSLLPAITQLKANIRPKELNATYLLLSAEPPKDMTAAWVLKNYDYARARSLLRLLPGQSRVGPYIVSSTTPLISRMELARPYLVQDLSSVPSAPKELASWWIREFMNQAAQQRFWDTQNAEQFAIRLRTTLAVLGAGLPDVKDSLKQWVNWIT